MVLFGNSGAACRIGRSGFTFNTRFCVQPNQPLYLVDEVPILIAAAGDCKVNSSKFKAEFHAKPKMIPFEEVERFIGHSAGGVCPFGINEGVGVYLDESLKRFDIVYPACGSSNSAVKLTISELEQASGYLKWVDVCKPL